MSGNSHNDPDLRIFDDAEIFLNHCTDLVRTMIRTVTTYHHFAERVDDMEKITDHCRGVSRDWHSEKTEVRKILEELKIKIAVLEAFQKGQNK